MDFNDRQLNEAFLNGLSNGSMEKTAGAGQDYIRDKLHEDRFCGKILPPQNITREECQRSVKHDTLVKIIDIEPNARAMPISFRGEPEAEWIDGDRFEIAFATVASPRYNKVEEELMAYEMPLTKIMDNLMVKAIGYIQDAQFLSHIESCVQGLQLEANTSATAYNTSNVTGGSVVSESVIKGELALAEATDNFNVKAVQRPDFVNLYNLLDDNELASSVILMTQGDYNDILKWTNEDMGDKITGETAIEGYKYTTILGRKFIRTIKTSVLRRGNVYAFTDPDFLGKFYVLNNTKFWAKKEFNRIEMMAWETVGMGIGNIASVRKMELYSGSVTPGDTDTGYADKLPKSYSDIFGKNNKVFEGKYYPTITATA